MGLDGKLYGGNGRTLGETTVEESEARLEERCAKRGELERRYFAGPSHIEDLCQGYLDKWPSEMT